MTANESVEICSFFKSIWMAFILGTLHSYWTSPPWGHRCFLCVCSLRPTALAVSGFVAAQLRDWVSGRAGWVRRQAIVHFNRDLPHFCSVLHSKHHREGLHVSLQPNQCYFLKELGIFSNVICEKQYFTVVFLIALLRNHLHTTKCKCKNCKCTA